MVGLPAFEASFEPTLADHSPLPATAISPYSQSAIWSCTPLELLVLANSYIFADHFKLLYDLSRAELLDFFSCELLFTFDLHAREIHCVTRLNVNPQVVSSTVDAEGMIAS